MSFMPVDSTWIVRYATTLHSSASFQTYTAWGLREVLRILVVEKLQGEGGDVHYGGEHPGGRLHTRPLQPHSLPGPIHGLPVVLLHPLLQNHQEAPRWGHFLTTRPDLEQVSTRRPFPKFKQTWNYSTDTSCFAPLYLKKRFRSGCAQQCCGSRPF
jgi:hypothetical protein